MNRVSYKAKCPALTYEAKCPAAMGATAVSSCIIVLMKFSKWSLERHRRIGIVNRFISGDLSRSQAAELAGISERQVTRIAKEVKDLGAGATLHKNIGNKPANSISSEVEEAILEIHSRPEYHGVNFLHFRDSLQDRHGISVPYPSLVSILKRHKKESPKKQRRRKLHRRRKRKEHPGELVQIDAAPFDWFRDGVNHSLHGAIDDATGEIVGLYMCRNECRLGYFEVMRQCVLNRGAPLSLYSDCHTIFRSPKEGKLTTEDLLQGKEANLTQFGRAVDELGTDIIFAKSPQAKGRVERMWETLQSRLPVEFALDGITTVEAANEYLAETVIPEFNRKWSVEAEGASLFVPLMKGADIDAILCVKEKRRTDNAGVFSFGNRAFRILDDGFPLVPRGQRIDVLIGWRTGIRVSYKGQVFKTIRYIRPVRGKQPKSIPRKAVASAKCHMKHGSAEWKEIWHAEDYDLSLKFLFDLFLAGSKAPPEKAEPPAAAD